MATPRRPTTPRRLFAGTTKKWVPTGSALQKRRRVTKYTPRSSGRRKSIKDVLQDLTQEKKKYERLQAFTTMHQMQTYLCGSEIYIGPNSFQRIGAHVTLTGIGIKGVVQHSGSGNTNTSGTWTNTVGSPVTLRIWIVSTKREQDPLVYWFQKQNDDSNANYNTGATVDPAGDVARSRFRMNRQEITVHKVKSYKVYPHRDIQQNFESLKNINIYHRLKKPIVLKYNADPTKVTQFTSQEVQPNVYICYALIQPDTNATVALNLAQMNCMFTMYYRE